MAKLLVFFAVTYNCEINAPTLSTHFEDVAAS